jgi:hypothetical protein
VETVDNFTPQWIIDDLAKSGLILDVFPVEPLRSEAELRERLGFTAIKDKSGNWIKIIDIGGYWIPYPNVQGYYRLKLRQEIIDSEGHKIKYLSPMKEKGLGNHAYILPEVMKIASTYSPDKPLFIAEGEKKAVKATLEGFPTIGLSGVSCYKDQDNDFLPELDGLIFKHRKCYIGFDSDITEKHNVRHAELRLAVEISNRDGIPFSIRFPQGGKK